MNSSVMSSRPIHVAALLALLATACAGHQPGPALARPALAQPALAPAAPHATVPPAAPARATRAPDEDAVLPRITPDADFRARRPIAALERPFKVPAVKRFRLKNGLPVILAESHKLPLVSIEMVIKTGSAANPKGEAGLADLTANMLDEGTKTRSALQIDDEISSLGAQLATGAAWDASSVSVSGLSENVDKALTVWADVLLNPAFDQKEFVRVKDNLVTALARRKDSPPTIAGITFARVVYGDGHPYGWPTSGTPETIAKLSPEKLRKFFDTHYRPGNAVLVAVGDITEADLRSKMDTLLKSWKAKAVPRTALPKAPPIARTKIYLVDKAGAPQSSIRLGLPGIERTSPDYHRALVMNQIVGGSFKRLDLNLREQKGWTYGARSQFEARRAQGPWSAGGEFVAAHTAEAVAEILREVRAMRDADITDAELQEVKDETIKAFPARFATVNQLGGQMATLAIYGLPDNDLETFTKKIAAVTKAEVRAMAKKYLSPEKMANVVVGDQKTNEPALRKIADVEFRDVDGMPLTTGAAQH